MPLFLRAASPAQVHALSPTNPQVLRLQSEDPDLQTLYAFRTTRAWPNNLQPDHRLCLETLNKNLMINQDNVVWVQCKPESPEAKTALYLPIKFRAPIICQFRQINPDLSVSQQVAKLQENYCWIGMKQDLQQQLESSANCTQLKVHKQTKSVPNAVVYLDVHGPFPFYGDQKFVAVLTDEARKSRPLCPWPPNQWKAWAQPVSWNGFAKCPFLRSSTPISPRIRLRPARTSLTRASTRTSRTTPLSTPTEVLVSIRKLLTRSTKWSMRPSSVGKIFFQPSTLPIISHFIQLLLQLRLKLCMGTNQKFP